MTLHLRLADDARGTTHGEDCWRWGPRHYDCALHRIAELEARVRELERHLRRGDRNAIERPRR